MEVMELQQVEITDQAAIALDTLIFQMQWDDWVYGAPNVEVDQMDRQIVEGGEGLLGMKCPRCGERTMQYHPFHREGEYKAWCLCGGCGERREL